MDFLEVEDYGLDFDVRVLALECGGRLKNAVVFVEHEDVEAHGGEGLTVGVAYARRSTGDKRPGIFTVALWEVVGLSDEASVNRPYRRTHLPRCQQCSESEQTNRNQSL